MSRYSQKFMSDLASLVSHGPKQFDSLIEDLSDPHQRDKLIEALRQLRRVASEDTRSELRVPPSGSFSYDDIRVPEIKDGNVETSEMLNLIHKKLTTAPTLQSRPVLMDLADLLNVPLAKRDTRPRIVQKILTSLADRDTDEISYAMNRIREADRGSTESFMELASFITRGSGNGQQN